MNVGDFIEGPCYWDRCAPVKLRDEAPVDVPPWQVYSTSRFLCDSEAEILDVFDVGGLLDDPGMNIELLPPILVHRWQSVGLRFATKLEFETSGFRDVLVKSLDIIRWVGPLQGTVAGLCRSLHPLLASCAKIDTSYSDPSVPFSVFVSCPPSIEKDAAERLAESLVHEALHLQLSLVENAEPLIIEASEGERVFSPWAGEGRTVRGLLHAVYVFGNLRFFWRQIASMASSSSSFARRRIAAIDEEMVSAMHLARNDGLTAEGRRLATSFLTA